MKNSEFKALTETIDSLGMPPRGGGIRHRIDNAITNNSTNKTKLLLAILDYLTEQDIDDILTYDLKLALSNSFKKKFGYGTNSNKSDLVQVPTKEDMYSAILEGDIKYRDFITSALFYLSYNEINDMLKVKQIKLYKIDLT